jgi:hypothetical protein
MHSVENGDVKERFINILSRGEEEDSSLHIADFEYTISILTTSNDPTAIKLACQAIDKVYMCCLNNFVF